jgi:hypothetical protein
MTYFLNFIFCINIFINTQAFAKDGEFKAIVRDSKKADIFKKNHFNTSTLTNRKNDWPEYVQRQQILTQIPRIAEVAKLQKQDTFWIDELIARAAGTRYSIANLQKAYPHFSAETLIELRRESRIILAGQP